jgi:hypothetical protein
MKNLIKWKKKRDSNKNIKYFPNNFKTKELHCNQDEKNSLLSSKGNMVRDKEVSKLQIRSTQIEKERKYATVR